MYKNFKNIFSVTLIWVFMLLLFTSCSKEHNSITEIDIVSNIDNFHNVKLSEFSKNIEYIALESDESALIRTISQIDISEKYIFIYDTKQCLLFNRSGKFMREISRKGNGPGEYRTTGQVKILNNELFIPNASRKSLMIFDTKNNYKNEIRSINCFTSRPYTENYFILNDSSFYIQIPNQSGKERNRIACINRQGNKIKKYANTTFFPRDKPRVFSTDKYADFYRYRGNIRYKEVLNDTVWQIEQENLIPVYVLKRGKFGTPNYYRGLPIREFSKLIKECIWIHKIFELKNYLIVKTAFNKNYPFDFRKDVGLNNYMAQHNIIGVYNKKTEEFFWVEQSYNEAQPQPTGIENDIDGGVNFMPNYIVCDSMLLGWVNAFELKHYISSKAFKTSKPKYPEKKKALEKLANSLNENDNPVLMLVKLKE